MRARLNAHTYFCCHRLYESGLLFRCVHLDFGRFSYHQPCMYSKIDHLTRNVEHTKLVNNLLHAQVALQENVQLCYRPTLCV